MMKHHTNLPDFRAFLAIILAHTIGEQNRTVALRKSNKIGQSR